MHVLDQPRNIAGRAVLIRAECPPGRFTKLYLRDIDRKTPVPTLSLTGTTPAATIGVQDG
jgi:hypothetical protein